MYDQAITVLVPTAVPIDATGKDFTPLHSLKGKRIGALWNTKPGGDDVLKELLAQFVQQHGTLEPRFYTKHSFGVAASDELIEQIAGEVDAVLTGVGD